MRFSICLTKTPGNQAFGYCSNLGSTLGCKGFVILSAYVYIHPLFVGMYDFEAFPCVSLQQLKLHALISIACLPFHSLGIEFEVCKNLSKHSCTPRTHPALTWQKLHQYWKLLSLFVKWNAIFLPSDPSIWLCPKNAGRSKNWPLLGKMMKSDVLISFEPTYLRGLS